jgi:hypothetical protein
VFSQWLKTFLICGLWGNLSLTEEEDVDVVIKNALMIVSREQSCLVGKLLTERLIGKEIIKSQLIRWCKPMGHPTLKVVGENLYWILSTFVTNPISWRGAHG